MEFLLSFVRTFPPYLALIYETNLMGLIQLHTATECFGLSFARMTHWENFVKLSSSLHFNNWFRAAFLRENPITVQTQGANSPILFLSPSVYHLWPLCSDIKCFILFWNTESVEWSWILSISSMKLHLLTRLHLMFKVFIGFKLCCVLYYLDLCESIWHVCWWCFIDLFCCQSMMGVVFSMLIRL